MMLRKSCPRCRGDLYLDRGDGPAAWNYLQCGRSFSTAVMQAQTPTGVPATTRAA